MKLMTVIGTRPEAVKMAPVLRALAGERGVRSLLCVTGQHRAMLDDALAFFALRPDHDLALMEPGQALNPLLSRAVEGLDRVFAEEAPDRVLVHGDTTTALAAALAAFHRGVPVAHVEAGLRTGRPADPWPEEGNRRTIDGLADLLFAPTAEAKANLLAENVSGRILVTGNSGIDALAMVRERLRADPAAAAAAAAALPALDPGRRLIVATCHRRESFGAPLRSICAAIVRLAARGDVQIVFPLHPNPRLRAAAAALVGAEGVHLVPPLGLGAFVSLLERADLVLTDSGGVQEEAAALGRPTLVLRKTTERPEGIRAGIARIAGTGTAAIVRAAGASLDARRPRSAEPRANPYGDGKASARIAAALLGRPVAAFEPAPEPPPPLRLIAG